MSECSESDRDSSQEITNENFEVVPSTSHSSTNADIPEAGEVDDRETPSVLVDADIWQEVDVGYKPRKSPPSERKPAILLQNINKDSTELDVFFSLFPRSLLLWIAENTNKRLKILEEKIKKPVKPTDSSQIMIVVGCYFIMSFSKLPSLLHYWSSKDSMGDITIKQAISRNRFQLIASKMYMNDPEKSANASKLYYIEDVVNCLKMRFQRARADSSY